MTNDMVKEGSLLSVDPRMVNPHGTKDNETSTKKDVFRATHPFNHPLLHEGEYQSEELEKAKDNMKVSIFNDLLIFILSLIGLVFADFLIDSSGDAKLSFFEALFLPYVVVNAFVNHILVIFFLAFALRRLFFPHSFAHKVSILLNIRRVRLFILHIIFALTIGI